MPIARKAYLRFYALWSSGSLHEARLVPTAVRLAELGLADGADPEQELELVARVGAHHLRAVRGDRERHPVLVEGAEGVSDSLLVRQRLRQQVRGRQISSTISASQIWVISLASCSARIPCPIRSGPSVETTSRISPTHRPRRGHLSQVAPTAGSESTRSARSSRRWAPTGSGTGSWPPRTRS